MATGTVKQIITFEATDKATAVARGVRDSLKGIGEDSRKATADAARVAADSGKAIDTVREKSGDVESALKGISDFAGASSDQVSKLGDSFGAVEAVMRLLPGPMGLTATAIVGAALGAKLLADYIGQANAKASLLTNAAGAGLAERLDLGVDGAVKLSKAFANLGEKAIRPSDLLLRQVAENARALGQDPADNVAKFIAAWKEGPEAVKAVQAEIGKLQTTFQTVEQVGAKMGLDTVALGLKEATQPAEQLKTALAEVAQREAEIAATQAQIKANNEEIKTAGVVRTSELFTQNRELERANGLQQINLDLSRQQAKDAAAKIDAQRLLTEIDAARNGQAQVAEIRAQLALSKEEAQRIRVQSITDQQASIEQEIASLLQLQVVFGDAFAKGKLEALQRSSLQLDVQKKQIADAEAAEKRAHASAAAAAARQRRQAAEAAAERERERAHQEWRNGVEAIKREAERLRGQAVRERAAELALESVRIEQTADNEIKAEQQIALIKKKAAEDIANLQADESLNRRARALETQRIEVEAELAVSAVREAEVKRQRDEAAKAFADMKTRAQSLIDIAAPAAEAAQAIGGPNGLGGALAAAAQQGRQLIGTWSDTESNASGIIGAVGNVAAAVVDGEKQKAAILGVMEGAQAIALAFTPGKQAEAAAHGAAALMYGAIAGGLIGGGSAPAATSGAPGGFAAQPTFAQPGGQQQMAAGTTVINFVAPLATRYEIGKSVVEAQKAAKGYAAAGV